MKVYLQLNSDLGFVYCLFKYTLKGKVLCFLVFFKYDLLRLHSKRYVNQVFRKGYILLMR
jgi:hypothetical protein